jgi:hypothetical protein
MTDPAKGSFDEKMALVHVVDLLTHYDFDLGIETANQLLDRWRRNYHASWIRWAVIEALYQGRYKAVSVDQILQLWNRRQQPCYHFSYEFERLVCNKFPRNLAPSRSLPSIPRIQPPQKFVPPVSEAAVLPELPSIKKLPPVSIEPPQLAAWAPLAEQIQQDELEAIEFDALDVPESGALSEPNTEPLEFESLELQLPDPIEDTERLLDATDTLTERVARLQAGVDALIEQATSSLNASTNAARTRFLAEGQSEELSDLMDGTEEIQTPIHQFMPTSDASDFHTKLKAVVEQNVVE